VADTSQLISGVAERYASSLCLMLAKEAGSIDAMSGADLDRFEAL
jgi:F-type H+-transporting ATPase subunit delta